ncbi:MAG TPA: PAS domain-containing protein [Puia sp.]|jgi:PAS domain S-box-containing protein|nr:PAS domain-containing protein [Puia sp.]
MADKLILQAKAFKKPESKNAYTGDPITEIIANGFFTLDNEWRVKYWNKAAEKLLGVQAKDIIGKNILEELASIIPSGFFTVCRKEFLQNIPDHFEEYRGEMGAWSDVITYHCNDTLSVSFKCAEHAALPAHSVQPQKQLKILNELYQFVTEVTNDCLWEWDLQAKEIFWIDGGHKRVFGYQIMNAIVPQSFWESRLHPDDKARILRRLHGILIKGTDWAWEDEYRFQMADGNYAYVHDRGHIIYDSDKMASRMIGATQDITGRKSAEIKLLESERKLAHERLLRQKQITQAVLDAKENERSEIGKELHDNLNQILGAAKLYIEMAQTGEHDRDKCLVKSSGYIKKVIEEIRTISKTLATPMMAIGLIDSIKNLIDDFIIVHPIKIEFRENGINEQKLDKKLQLTIFRITQEQLNNILKHSKASHVTVSLTKQAKKIILMISDDGKGFNISEQYNGVGILNIKSRVELYHGNVMIVTKPGEGCKLNVELPLKGKT